MLMGFIAANSQYRCLGNSCLTFVSLCKSGYTIVCLEIRISDSSLLRGCCFNLIIATSGKDKNLEPVIPAQAGIQRAGSLPARE